MKPALRLAAALFGLALLGLLLDGLVTWLSVGPAAPAWAWLWLAGWLLLLGGFGWLGRDWRSMAPGLRVVWGLLGAWTLASLLLAAGPWAQARWLQPQAQAAFELLDAGRTLQWRGAVTPGDAARLQALLVQSPQLRRLDLQGSGGSLPEALRIAELMRAHPLDSRASGPCQGACAALFMGGRRRQLLPEGQLGFQQVIAPSLNPLWRQAGLRLQQRFWQELGLSAAFAQRALLTRAPRWWTPDRADVLAEGGAPAPIYPLDLALPAQPGAQPGEYLQALRSHTTWRLLEVRLPGTLAEAQSLLLSVHAEGDDAAAQLALHRYALQRERRLLAGASVEMRDLFMDLQRERLQALQQDSDCQALLAGDAGVRRQLPPDLAQRERVWLEDAAVEPPPAPPSRHVVALDAEVLRRTWNRQGLAMLDRLAPDGSRVTPLACAPAVQLLSELRNLPAAQRKPAQRRLFD